LDDQNDIVFPAPLSVNYFPELKPGEVHVWYAYFDEARLRERCLEVLTTAEFEHISYYKFEKDQNSFIVSRGLLRILLSSYVQVEADKIHILKHPKGKPYQQHDPCLVFNLSNSGDCCVFAFSRNGEVGIDIEKIRPLNDLDELIRKNFNSNEQAYINAGATLRLHRFVKFWTLKEALLKAIGEGMRLTPEKLEFSCENDAFTLRSLAGIVESDEWVFSDLAFNHAYKGSIAHKKISGPIKLFKFE
jgi:4'-phosphopantetheinyl transferase